MNKWKLLITCGTLCAASQFAYAGGPEMPPPGHSAIFVGVGGAYDYMQYKDTILAPTESTNVGWGAEDENSVFGLSPIAQLGYDYFFGSGGFFGIKGLFNFVDKNTSYSFTTGSVPITNPQAIFELKFMVQAMLEGGVCINNNAFYLEAGYSVIFTKLTLRDAVAGGQLESLLDQHLNGGVAGIGYRHYFWDTLFVDAVYSYSLYQDGSINVGDSISAAPRQDSAQLKKVRVQDILFTVNYAFNF